MKKFVVFILSLIISIFACLTVFADDSCQHHFVCNDVSNGEVSYSCSKCGYTFTKSIIDVYRSWTENWYNQKDSNSFLDLVPDGIVNAKDYVKIKNEYINFKSNPSLEIGGEI